MWIGCQGLKIKILKLKFHTKIPPSSSSWQNRKSDGSEHSPLWDSALRERRDWHSSVQGHAVQCTGPMRPPHSLIAFLVPQEWECVTPSPPRKVPYPWGTVRDLEPQREKGMMGKMRLREERRNPGILEAGFIPSQNCLHQLEGFLPWDRSPRDHLLLPALALLQKLVQWWWEVKRVGGKWGF